MRTAPARSRGRRSASVITSGAPKSVVAVPATVSTTVSGSTGCSLIPARRTTRAYRGA
jgi:hypothetical protein